jgi:hypothetical protein
MRNKCFGLLMAVGLLVPLGFIGASPAGAASLLTCTKLAGTATWTPPVSPTVKATHTVTAKATLSGCTGTKGITSGVTSFLSKGTTKENCAVLIASKAPSTASASVKWSNGKTSVLAKLTLTYGGSVGAQVITGKITGGTQTSFIGKTTKLTSQFIPNGGGCLTKGVSLKTASVSLKKGTKSTLG